MYNSFLKFELREMQAYIFINTEPGKLWKVADVALKINGVKMAHAVTGEFDVIVFAEFPKIEDLKNAIDKLHSLDGVIRTHTAIVMPFRLEFEEQP